jgi:hypothetical protein
MVGLVVVAVGLAGYLEMTRQPEPQATALERVAPVAAPREPAAEESGPGFVLAEPEFSDREAARRLGAQGPRPARSLEDQERAVLGQTEPKKRPFAPRPTPDSKGASGAAVATGGAALDKREAARQPRDGALDEVEAGLEAERPLASAKPVAGQAALGRGDAAPASTRERMASAPAPVTDRSYAEPPPPRSPAPEPSHDALAGAGGLGLEGGEAAARQPGAASPPAKAKSVLPAEARAAASVADEESVALDLDLAGARRKESQRSARVDDGEDLFARGERLLAAG